MPKGASHVVLGFAPTEWHACGSVGVRVLASRDHDRRVFTALPKFLHLKLTMMCRLDQQTKCFLIMDLTPVNTDIDPALLWISCNGEIAGSKVTSTIMLVIARNWKF